jgi:hypothetical protein
MLRLFFPALICLCFKAHCQLSYLPVAPHLLLYTNPSFAGTSGGLRFQYCATNIEGRSPIMFDNNHPRLFAADGYVKQLKTGFGFSFFNYGFGTAGLQLTAAPHIKLNANSKLIPSLQVGLPYDRYYSQGTLITLGPGLLYNYKRFYAGAYAAPLVLGKSTYVMTEQIINTHTSYNFLMPDKHLLNLFVKYGYSRYSQAAQMEFNSVVFKYVQAGAGYIFYQQRSLLSSYYLNRSAVYFNAGYRNNYFYILLNLQSQSFSTQISALSWQWTMGLTIRPHDRQKILVNFEEM